VLLAPVIGPGIFLMVMWAVFQVTTLVAQPLQNLLARVFAGPISDGVSAVLAAIGLGGTWVEGLAVNGLIAGVGLLLSFVPLLTLMFLLLALLEESGYLARAAVLTERVMGVLGLPGRAFLPLVVGFGCNVPAVTATRGLPRRERLLTAMLIPFTACSGRLTVFVVLGTMFFGKFAGTVVFGLYVTSILLVIITGVIWRQTLLRRLPKDAEPLALPAYRWPNWRGILSSIWARLKDFLVTASGIIVVAVIVIWVFQATPVTGGQFGHVGVEDSLYAWLAKLIAPLFAPAGFNSWQAVAALGVGLFAKEAVIASWGQTYATMSTADLSLSEQLWATFEASSGGHGLAAVLAYMVFLLAYTPCLPTVAVLKREIGLRWTGLGIAVQLVVASVVAILVFQVARLVL
jgi:ferrous iron transport protein B